MSPSNHAVDGSFRRDTRVRLGRAVALIVVAVVLAVILLRHNGGSSKSRPTLAAATTTSTTAPASTTVPAVTSTTVAATTVPPAQLKVVVTNGTTKAGAAGFFKTKLAAKGYDVLLATNATSSSILDSAVYYQAGFRSEAVTLAAALGLPSTTVTALSTADPVPTTAAASADVIVVVGGNLAVQA